MKLLDRTYEQTGSGASGTGSLTLTGAVAGFKTFLATAGNSVEFAYVISDASSGEWECGIGHVTTGTTLVRDVVLTNHLSTQNAVNFTAGVKDVFSDATSLSTFFQLDLLTLTRQSKLSPPNLDHMYPSYFGTGSDGDDILSADTELLGPKNYRSLTITGGNIKCNGYRIYVQNVLLITGGRLHADGLSAVGPVAPGAGSAGECLGSTPGGQTNDGPFAGSGYNGENVTVGDGGSGGAGGTGGATH